MERRLWTSWEDLRAQEGAARTSSAQQLLELASAWEDPVTRRGFLKIMGASIALAGLGGCTWFPAQKIVPYVSAPGEIVPGQPLFYATSFVLGGFAQGILAETHMGRPTKIEGNPQHPFSRGATDPFMQASVLSLYDPERGKTVTQRGLGKSWEAFDAWVIQKRAHWKSNGGADLRFLTETVTSPSLVNGIRGLLAEFPNARWHHYEPINRDFALEGARLAFGRELSPLHHFNQARVIFSLDADFLLEVPGHLRYARDFADRRRVRAGHADMNRLYVAESGFSLTGAMADHRLPIRFDRALDLAVALARTLGMPLRMETGPGLLPLDEKESKWISALAADLKSSAGQSLILAGNQQPPELHALVFAMNDFLRNAGKAIEYTEVPEARGPGSVESLQSLAEEMSHGKVDTLFILGGNPAYTAPKDFRFSESLKKVPNRVKMGLHEDETSFLCDWYLPEAHLLESWGDARSLDGTISLIQPTIAPLYQGKTHSQLLAALSGNPGTLDRDLLQQYWKSQWDQRKVGARPGPASFDDFWRKSLHDGYIEGSELPKVQASARSDAIAAAASSLQKKRSASAAPATLSIRFQPDSRVWDGRFANNAWLQELPKPLTQACWDNPAILSPATAKRLGLKEEDVVLLAREGATVEAPVTILPGHPDDTVTVHLGYGRARAGSVGKGHGFNAYELRASHALWHASDLELKKTGKTHPLAHRQVQPTMEGRDLVLIGTQDEFKADPGRILPKGLQEKHPSILPEYPYENNAWAMVIDLNVCIGCKACTIACQAENNIPVVGKEQVRKGRAMHWIRVDRYYHGPAERPRTVFQPVPCMHCEKAPCELVCPVEATVHSPSGLNEMIYNRCVGTRYCSNNCPYKVRRFNFLQYSESENPLAQLRSNPEVTIRSRGVMEKCTYCVQRIQAARIQASQEQRPIRDGEVVTACQGACPTGAILFGDKNDPKSEVAGLKREPHNYDLLAELGTRPRTSYLAKLLNPNPALKEG